MCSFGWRQCGLCAFSIRHVGDLGSAAQFELTLSVGGRCCGCASGELLTRGSGPRATIGVIRALLREPLKLAVAQVREVLIHDDQSITGNLRGRWAHRLAFALLPLP